MGDTCRASGNIAYESTLFETVQRNWWHVHLRINSWRITPHAQTSEQLYAGASLPLMFVVLSDKVLNPEVLPWSHGLAFAIVVERDVLRIAEECAALTTVSRIVLVGRVGCGTERYLVRTESNASN